VTRLHLATLPERAVSDLVTAEARGASIHDLRMPLILAVPPELVNGANGLKLHVQSDGTFDPEIRGSVGYIREGAHSRAIAEHLREAHALAGCESPDNVYIDFCDPIAHLIGAWTLARWLGLAEPHTSAFVARDHTGWCLWVDGICYRWTRSERAWTCGLPLSFPADLDPTEDETLPVRERNATALAALITAHAAGAGYDRKSRLRMAAKARMS
jgi:hypothetical protein